MNMQAHKIIIRLVWTQHAKHLMIAKEKFDKKELFEAWVRFEFEVPSKYNNCFDPANPIKDIEMVSSRDKRNWNIFHFFSIASRNLEGENCWQLRMWGKWKISIEFQLNYVR